MNNLSVLIVDDSNDFANGLKRVFESFGWQAQIANDQEKANFLFADDPYDLVIVDCFIPGADGFVISKELSDFNTETKGDSIFFLMSGILTDEASKKEVLSYGHIKDFIKKPIDTKALKRKLDELFPEDQKSILDFFIQPNSTLAHFNAYCGEIKSLEQLELPFLIKQLSELEFSGEIKFSANEGETVLNFNNGDITSVFSQSFEDSMGELLVGLGYLTRENLSDYVASESFSEGKQRIGEALIAKNYISPHAVPLALKEQKKIRLKKLLSSNQRVDFTICEKPFFEHDPSTCLNSSQITDCLMYFLADLGDEVLQPKILKPLKGMRVKTSSVPVDDFVISELESAREEVLKKHNESDKMKPSDVKHMLSLMLCRGLEFSHSEEVTPIGSSEKNLIKEKLRYLAGKIKLDTPYEVLDLSPDNITDQRVSKKYQNLAKELHPDKLGKILKEEELKEAERVFAEITKSFNSIKTAENRRTYESLKAIEEAQDQMDCNNALERAKKALDSGKYTEAITILDTPKMHKNYPNEFGLYFLWASFKNKDHILNLDPNTILKNEHKNLQNEPLYYYLKAIIANKNNDMQGFQKFINMSLKADSHFLPARREMQIVRSQKQEPKPTKSSWFSFKKSS